MASNMYKVGDWVYCEVSPYQPYVIRKIEELTKTPNGNVEAKVICAFRRREVPPAVLATIEPKAPAPAPPKQKDDQNTTANNGETNQAGSLNGTDLYDEEDVKELSELQRYQLKHRELFYSKCTESIPVTSIRGKCAVLLFSDDIERYRDYVTHDDKFYYHLTYDEYQKQIVDDKGEIKVGTKYQAEVAPHFDAKIAAANAKLIEDLKWNPSNTLSDNEIDQFLTIAKSVGTFARALDCNNAFKQPSLPLSAAAASRDITLFHAMNTLHENEYDIGKAALSLITDKGPIICRDEMEEWSAAEANLFEEALDKYGKDFNEVRKDYLPWKSMKSIIEYYYSWKTTDRYVQQKKIKSSEQESKLKQVFIPNHAKQSQSSILKGSHMQILQQNEIALKSCESCGQTQSPQWYLYNPTPAILALLQLQHQIQMLPAQNQQQQTNANPNYQARLCNECWQYWKKHSSFKYPSKAAALKNQVFKCTITGCQKEFKQKQLLSKHCQVAHGIFTTRPGSPKPLIRNRHSFYLMTTPMSRASRFVCKSVFKMKKAARKPTKLIEFAEVTKEWNKKPRNIKEIIDTNTNKYIKILPKKLSRQLIGQIYRRDTDAKSRRDGNADTEKLVIDYEGDDGDAEYEDIINKSAVDGPEYLAYFGKRFDEPVYVPEKFLYPKPSEETMNKFFMNLMAQTRKRSHEQSEMANGAANGKSSDALVSPSKKPMSAPSGKPVSNSHKGGSDGPVARLPMKLVRNAQNSGNNESELFFVASKSLKAFRRDNDTVDLKKLARTPQKALQKQHAGLYNEISKFVKVPAKSELSLNGKSNGHQSNGVDLSVKSTNGTVEENGKHAAAVNGVNEDEDMEKEKPAEKKVNGASEEVVLLD